MALAGCGTEIQAQPGAPTTGASSRPSTPPEGRYYHTLTQQKDGSWLVAGGYTMTPRARRVLSHTTVISADLKTARQGPTMADARWGHTATALSDGVLLLGGSMETPERSPFKNGRPELLASGASSWRGLGGMTLGLALHTATLLADGRVLIAGGADGYEKAQSAGWLFDPKKRVWSRTAPMRYARFEHTATVLADGRVLVVGGHIGVGCGRGCPIDCYDDSDCSMPDAACADGFYCAAPIAMAEVFDPKTNTWSLAGALSSARVAHAALRLSDGRVLISGGRRGRLALDTVEIFDPNTVQWRPGPTLNQARFNHTATLMPDGKVITLGGRTNAQLVLPCDDGVPCVPEWIQMPLAAVEISTPGLSAWRLGPALTRMRWGHTAAHAGGGKLLVWGGAGLDALAVEGGEVFEAGQWRRIKAPRR